MDKINDYNLSLLQALHGWFWYNGLLDQVDDEWVEFGPEEPRFARPKYDENCVILKLITVLRETDTESLTSSYLREHFNLDMYYNDELNVLWLLLVKMFGDYGCSPRSGWIEKRSACADFLETVVEIEELEYLNSIGVNYVKD